MQIKRNFFGRWESDFKTRANSHRSKITTNVHDNGLSKKGVCKKKMGGYIDGNLEVSSNESDGGVFDEE